MTWHWCWEHCPVHHFSPFQIYRSDAAFSYNGTAVGTRETLLLFRETQQACSLLLKAPGSSYVPTDSMCTKSWPPCSVTGCQSALSGYLGKTEHNKGISDTVSDTYKYICHFFFLHILLLLLLLFHLKLGIKKKKRLPFQNLSSQFLDAALC